MLKHGLAQSEAPTLRAKRAEREREREREVVREGPWGETKYRPVPAFFLRFVAQRPNFKKSMFVQNATFPFLRNVAPATKMNNSDVLGTMVLHFR